MPIRPSRRRHGPAAALLVLLLSAGAQADPPGTDGRDFELHDELAAGIARHQLDGHTEVTGWRLGDSWYFGHADGDQGDSVALIWRGERQQLNISTEGIRFTRRF